MPENTPDSSKTADVAVIIPAYNPEIDLLRNAVAYFLDNEQSLVGEILVIDDGSRKPVELAEVLGTRVDSRVRVLRRTNGGVGAARNFGVSRSQAPIVAFLDCDCLPQPGWAASLTTPVREGRAVLACGATLTFDMAPLVAQYADLMGFLREPVRHRGEIENAVQANFAVLRSLFLELHGFEEALRRTQDLDFTWRLIQAGHQERIVYVPEARLLHKHRDTLRAFLKQGFQNGQGGMAHCLLRGRDQREVFALRPTFFGALYQVAAAIVVASRACRRAAKRFGIDYRVLLFPCLALMRSACYNWGSFGIWRRYKKTGKLIFT
ncbi:MAG: glycosyltransferase [Opitutaceae bacterium]|jgi:glycosyltransferase involved in cell wall biosynthesis